MSWSATMPQDTWDKTEGRRELYSFLREVFTRGRTFGAFTWNPPNVPGASTVDTTLTTTDATVFTGLRRGQAVYATPPSTIDAGIVVTAWAPNDDELTIRLGNVTAVAINPVSGTWTFQGVIV